MPSKIAKLLKSLKFAKLEYVHLHGHVNGIDRISLTPQE